MKPVVSAHLLGGTKKNLLEKEEAGLSAEILVWDLRKRWSINYYNVTGNESHHSLMQISELFFDSVQ
jgi:hypothetical protein